MKKKLLSILVVLAMVVAMLPALTITALAASEQIGDYKFDKATGTITGYTGAGGDLEIPATLGGVEVKSIGVAAFRVNKDITSVVIPASVTSINEAAFEECSNITSVTFAAGSKLSSIGDNAFYYCEKLESISIPAGVTIIGSWAFKQCNNITSVTFEAGSKLDSIESSAFCNCDDLESITLPESVTAIGEGVFSGCGSLKSISIPAGVTSIGSNTFLNCQKITSITFPADSQLSSIGIGAFSGCTSLENITIPANVSSIDSQAFYWCTNLKNVIIKAVTPPLDVNNTTFNGCHNNLSFHVPAASVEAYKVANGWSGYADKIVAFHDLKVTKNNGEAVENTDYQWEDNNTVLKILTDGLIVSGTTEREVIYVDSSVKNLTIKDLSISMDSWTGNAPYAKGLIYLYSNEMTLTLVGNNRLETTLEDTRGLWNEYNGGSSTIKGEGNLTVLHKNKQNAIFAQSNLTFAQTGTITASGKSGISATNITFINGIGKILARGDDDKGALYHFGNPGSITFEDELLKKGSTKFEAKETDINSDIEIKDKCAKIGDDVAKSVLIQPKQYDVTVSSEIKNGKVKADKEKAAKGETVTLTVTPSECYKLVSLKVTDADKKEITVTDNKFVMPASNVAVTAEFKTVEYKMIKGEKQEIDLTDVKDAVFASEADYSKFKSVMVDDKTVDAKNYTVKSGSTVVTLKADYLKTLKTGKHEIKILSDDGMATAEFTIVKTTPKTADANNMLLWIVLALAAISLTTCTVLRVKRTNK